MITTDDLPMPAGEDRPAAPAGLRWLLVWPGSALLIGSLLALLFVPAIAAAFRLWLTDESHSHGIFIVPISLGLLYVQRDAIRATPPKPTAWGFAPLAIGLFLFAAAYLSRLDWALFWPVAPTLAGMVLVLHGRALWSQVSFPITFLVFAAQFPFPLLYRLNLWIKFASTSGAVGVMRVLGYSIIQTGNMVQIPGHSLEVADVCSGYKKLIALLAFAALYGYIFRTRPVVRLLLFIAAIPIAVIANVIRVAGLIMVTSVWGESGLHVAHDWAEIVVLVLAFGLFVLAGKVFGCRELRFTPPSPSS